jgi:putative heme iron utilization protein
MKWVVGRRQKTNNYEIKMKKDHATPDLKKLASNYRYLLQSQQTLLLGTASNEGRPHMSYAPYVQDQEDCFYIFISDLALHTNNLLQNPSASILFLKPEIETENLFARERLTYYCDVQEVHKTEVKFNLQLQAFQEKFGNVVAVLKSLPDFHLFSLQPESGQYVVGFGNAYHINIADGQLELMVVT